MAGDYSQTLNRFTQLHAYPLPKTEELVNTVAQYKFLSTIYLKSSSHQVPAQGEDKQYTAFEACPALCSFQWQDQT